MGLTWLLLVVLPLLPARPMLGPIYVQMDHLMPPDFPLLLIVPALGIDLAMRRVRGHDWRLALVAGVLFVVVFLAAQWPFADFLMTRWARNWIFATDRMPYYADVAFQHRWYMLDPPAHLSVGLPIAAAIASVSARCGLWCGNWMARVQR